MVADFASYLSCELVPGAGGSPKLEGTSLRFQLPFEGSECLNE